MNSQERSENLTLLGVVLLAVGLFLMAMQVFGGDRATPVGASAEKVTVCHKPEGANPHEIEVDDDAVEAHLAHGDTLGPCGEDGTSTPGPHKVLICHKPEGANPHTIEVDESAVPAHLAHGDTLGACEAVITPTQTALAPTATATSAAPTSTATSAAATSTATAGAGAIVEASPTGAAAQVAAVQSAEEVAPVEGVAGVQRLPGAGSGGGEGDQTLLIAGVVLAVLGAGLTSLKLVAPRS